MPTLFTKFINAITGGGKTITQTVAMPVNNSHALYPTWDAKKNAERYCNTDDVYSVIRLLATTAAMVPFYPYTVKDKVQKRKLKDLSVKAPIYQHEGLQKKALQEMDEGSNLFMLLEKPTVYGGKFEFFEALYTLLFLQGEAFIWKEIKEFGANKGEIEKLHIWFPQWVVLHVSDTFPFDIISYDYMVDGIPVMLNVPKDEVIHIKYFNPNFGVYNNNYRGHSPLKSLSRVLTRLDAGLDASVAQMQNGGVPGIVWDKSETGTTQAVDTIGQRKTNFYNYATKLENKGMPFFASGDMGYIELGLKLADLEVADLAKIDFKKLCNAYGVSDILFNNSDASTESNVEIMFKRLYTNTVLPNVQRVRDAFNMHIVPHYNTKQEVFINFDLSGIAELQNDQRTLAETLAKSWWLTPNEKREAMRFGLLDNEYFNEPLVPNNITTLEDLEMNKTLPINGEYSRQNRADSEEGANA